MMGKIITFFKHYSPRNYLAPLLTGVLVGTSYIPFPPWALIFCYVPLWLFLFHRAKTWQEGFAAGWWAQFTLTLIGFHWIAHVTKEFGGFPWPVAFLTLLLFAALAHLYIPLTTALVVFLKKKYSWSLSKTLLASALLLSIAERIWPSLFQWHLGYTLLWSKAPAYNWADVLGFEGLSTIVLFLNAWVAWIWEQHHQRRALQSHSLLLVLFLVLFNLSGYFHGQFWNVFDRKIKVSLIQANIGNEEKVYAEKGQRFQDEILNKFLKLTREAVAETPNTELIVWPETAFPDYLDPWNSRSRIPLLLAAGLQPLGKTLLTGAYAKDSPGERSPRLSYNALFLVDSNAHQMGNPYHKTNLLAFGEYLPLSERFPVLLKLLPFISNFGRGKGPEIIIYPHPEGDLKLGAQVCYEGLYPEFTRGLAEKQADILANVTNDSWFGGPFEPRQHMLMTLARAIEVRRPLIRSTNTGISTVILANGDVLQQSPLHEEWQGSYDLQMKREPPTTSFVLWGHYDWILILFGLFVLLVKGVLDARPHRA
ncbi:MAG: apolipoprotein N-acyltransferase [Pseudobdellovibrionaceae bacterium]